MPQGSSSSSGSTGYSTSTSTSGTNWQPWQLPWVQGMPSWLKGQLPGADQFDFSKVLGQVQGAGQAWPTPVMPTLGYTPASAHAISGDALANLIASQGAQAGASQARDIQARAAGAGWGANSPQANFAASQAALLGQTQGQAGATQQRFQAAQTNAANALAAALANTQASTQVSGQRQAAQANINQIQAEQAARQRELAIAQENMAQQRYNAILNAMNYYLQPLPSSSSTGTSRSGSFSQSGSGGGAMNQSELLAALGFGRGDALGGILGALAPQQTSPGPFYTMGLG